MKKQIKKIIKKLLVNFPKCLIKISQKDLLETTNWIPKLQKRFLVISKIFPDYPLTFFLSSYATFIEGEIVQSPQQFNKIKSNWISFFSRSNDDIKMFMSKLFFLSGIFDDQISKLLMSFADETNDKNYRYWTCQDISFMTFSLQKGYYPDFYNDRRQIMKKIALENSLSFSTPNVKADPNTVCILTYCLSDNIHNSMQRVATMVAKGMKTYYKNIYVLSLESFGVPKNRRKKVTSVFFSRNFPCRRKINKLFGKDIKVLFAKGKTFQKRMQSSLETITKINPSAIIDISDEFSPTSFFYSQKISTFYIPMRNYASSSFFTKTLGRIWKYDYVNSIFHSIPREKICDWCFPEYIPPKSAPLKREDMGIDKNAFVILSIGNNDKDCDPRMVDVMDTLLTKESSFIWLLVGSGAPNYLRLKYKCLLDTGRVIEHGYENNLSGLCSACDVLLRFNTTGGSGGTAIAAMEGLPIVMTSFVCDPMRWLGKDYSHFQTYDELADEIIHLFSSKDYYKERSDSTKEKVKKASNFKESWYKLASIIDLNTQE